MATQIHLTAAHRRTLARHIDNQSSVARAVGCTPAMICQILAGTKQPSPDTLRAICRAVGLRCRIVPATIQLRKAGP